MKLNLKSLLTFTVCLYSTNVFANTCKPLIWEADKENDKKVYLNGKVNSPNAKVTLEVYYGRELIGKNIVYSASNGSFSGYVYTRKPASMRPDVQIICRR